MNISQAKNVLSIDCKDFSLTQLQKHYVKLLDAWRNSKAEYGFNQAIKDGFYVKLESESASGYVPKDLHLTHNILTRLDEVEKLLAKVTK